jgi:hypothetical protein
VHLVAIHAGFYRVLSTDGHAWYLTDVKNVTCTCWAGAYIFRHCTYVPWCRHMAAAKHWAKCLHDTRALHRQPPAATPAPLPAAA